MGTLWNKEQAPRVPASAAPPSGFHRKAPRVPASATAPSRVYRATTRVSVQFDKACADYESSSLTTHTAEERLKLAEQLDEIGRDLLRRDDVLREHKDIVRKRLFRL